MSVDTVGAGSVATTVWRLFGLSVYQEGLMMASGYSLGSWEQDFCRTGQSVKAESDSRLHI